jgi:hypothetical protein
VNKDLFGNPAVMPAIAPRSKYQNWRAHVRYREAEVKERSCKFCEFAIELHHHGKKYFKCKFTGTSSSEASDIRLKNTCDKFKKDLLGGGG